MGVQKFNIQQKFGAAVKVWRKLLGISQEELAERSDLHRTYISDVERGARNLSLKSMEKLAEALHVSIFDFFHSPELMGEGGGFDTHRGFPKKFVQVLLVEDSADDVALTLHAFKQARFTNQIHVVRDGAEALDYLFCRGEHAQRSPENRPQIILLDLNLPKVSGLDVLRQIKADKSMRDCSVVVLTVSARSRDIEECLRLGADGYIVKPVDFQSLSRTTPQLSLDWALLKPMETKASKVTLPSG
jgi:CheY-like chemotaxis protein/DNA-binding XRE family transcriptional regulator